MALKFRSGPRGNGIEKMEMQVFMDTLFAHSGLNIIKSEKALSLVRPRGSIALWIGSSSCKKIAYVVPFPVPEVASMSCLLCVVHNLHLIDGQFHKWRGFHEACDTRSIKLDIAFVFAFLCIPFH